MVAEKYNRKKVMNVSPTTHEQSSIDDIGDSIISESRKTKEPVNQAKHVKKSVAQNKRRNKPEFPTSLVSLYMTLLKQLSILFDILVQEIPLLANINGKRKQCFASTDKEVLNFILVQTKGLRSVYCDLTEIEKRNEGYYWIKVKCDKTPSALRFYGNIRVAPSVSCSNHEGNNVYYWFVKAKSESDALNLQKLIAKKIGGTCTNKRPTTFRVPDHDYFFCEEIRAEGMDCYEGKTHNFRLNSINERCTAESIANDLELKFIPIHQEISFSLNQVRPINKKDLPLLISFLAMDFNRFNFGHIETAYFSILATVGTISSPHYSFEYECDDIFSFQNSKTFFNGAFSTCIIGRANDGVADTLNMTVNALKKLEEELSVTNLEKANEFKAEDVIYQGMLKKKNAVAIEKVCEAEADGKRASRKVERSVVKQLVEYMGKAPKLTSCNYLLHSNNVDVIQTQIEPSNNGIIHLPLNSARFLKSLQKEELHESSYSKQLTTTSTVLVKGSPVMSSIMALTANEFDNVCEEAEQEIKTYSSPIYCFDTYICSTHSHTRSDSPLIYQEEDFSMLSDFFLDLHHHIETRASDGSTLIPFDNKSIELLECFDQGIDTLVKATSEASWIIRALKGLKVTVRKLSLNIEIMNSYDQDDCTFEEIDSISRVSVRKGIAAANFIKDNLLMLSSTQHIDYQNALSLRGKLKNLKGEFTARTLYKDKGWAGVKNNPSRAEGALDVLQQFDYVFVSKVIASGDKDVIHYQVNPSVLGK